MAYKRYISNFTEHYSFIAKASHPVAIQVFLLTWCFSNHSLDGKTYNTVNSWLRSLAYKIAEIKPKDLP